MNVARVQQIKTSIGGDDFFSSATQRLAAISQLIQANDFAIHTFAIGLSLICAKFPITIVMSKNNFSQEKRKSKLRDDFRLSNGPVVDPHTEPEKGGGEVDDALKLPCIHAAPMLFAIARDPRTVFAYWNVDWLAIFAKIEPVDRQVHLRVHRADGVEEKSVAAEPMGGNCYIAVSRPGGSYHVELGYFQPADVWHSVATSDEVILPSDDFADEQDFDLATIPLHLSFQHLIDLFGPANGDDLAYIISRFQKRALSAEWREQPNIPARDAFRAMDLSLSEIAGPRCAFANAVANKALRERPQTFQEGGSS